ncbi:MAG: hypothetical protein OHK0017_06670 [Patescibacteria group bacterium]
MSWQPELAAVQHTYKPTMLSLTLSLLLLGLCIAGVILTLSGMINSYLKKKLEYIAYKNQLQRAKNPELNYQEVQSEEDYYKTHQLGPSNLNLAFLSKDNASAILKAENLKEYTQRVFQDTKTAVQQFDYQLFWSKIKLNTIKLYKYIQNKVKELWKLFMTLAQPNEQNENSMTVGELNKKLERDRSLNVLLEKKDSKDTDDFIDNELEAGKFRKRTNTDDLVDKIQQAETKTELNQQQKAMYQELENELLHKLQSNMSNLSIWESLGNFYLDNRENEKCRDVFQYVLDHSQSTTQSNRIRKKLAEMSE